MTSEAGANKAGEKQTKGTWLAWLGTFLLFVCVAHGNFETTDAGFTMHAARGLWHRGDSALRTQAQGGDHIGEYKGAEYIRHSEQIGKRASGLTYEDRTYVWYPIGHIFLMTPFIPLGEAVETLLPDADARLQKKAGMQSWVRGSPVVTQAVISMLLPSLCFATSILLLFRIARVLGAAQRDAMWTAVAIALATQAFAVGREQLSDGPGLMFMLAALLPMVRLHLGTHSRQTAWWAGAMAGCAVLLRYQTALTVAAFAVLLVLACRRRKSYRDLWLFAAGGAPLALLFLLTNYLRFGDPTVTGYPAIGDWFTANPLPGLGKILFGAGRGIMWFSPLLWLALPYALLRRHKMKLRWLAWVLFVTPLLIFMQVTGWQGGQAWAIRYVTPGVVALLVIVLPQVTPWHKWPGLWRALVVVGWFVSITSVITPVRGQLQLAHQAVTADLTRAVAEGRMTYEEANVDPADYGGWHPHFTPLVANWLYALHSRTNFFEDENQKPRHGSKHSIVPLYGVAAVDEVTQGNVPVCWADRSGRHLWWRFWGDLYGVSSWLLVLPIAVLGALLAFFGWRRLAGLSDFTIDPVAPHESATPSS
ncbi:MAG: 4-amino-4-deoxy-L-arabinose transferase-like glycosyltransferase [Planctomycetota bacterium]